MIMTLTLILFTPALVCGDDFTNAKAINDFFRGRKIDSIEGIWKWETAAGQFEGAIINLDKLESAEKIREQYGKNIQYACLLTQPSRNLPAETLVIALNPAAGGVHKGYYITYGYDYFVGHSSNEIPFSVSLISESTLAFGTTSPGGGEIVNEAKRVYPTTGSLSFNVSKNSGTGFFIAPGIIVTAFSNIASAQKISVQCSSGMAEVDVLVRDRSTDLAILQVNSKNCILPMGTPLPVGDVREVKEGDKVFSAFFDDAYGFAENRFVEGFVISDTGEKNDPRVFEVDISSGKTRNGAPLLNSSFQVIGILVDIGQNHYFQNKTMIPEGIFYAVKINNIFNLAASARECPKLSLGDPDRGINELTVFNSIALVNAEGVK